MRHGVDGKALSRLERSTFMTEFKPIFKANIQVVANDLKNQLQQLKDLNTEDLADGWDPMMRLES